MIKKIARCCLCRKPILDIEAYAVIVGDEVPEEDKDWRYEKIEGIYCHQECLRLNLTKEQVGEEE